jgi:hypothetical protein
MIVAHFSPLQQISFMYVNSKLSNDSSERLKLTKGSLQHRSSWVTMLTLWFRCTEGPYDKAFISNCSFGIYMTKEYNKYVPLSSYKLLEK